MMENSSPEIHEIFKVPVYKVKLDLDIKRLQSFCDGYKHKNKTVRVSNNVGGYQSNDLPLTESALQPLIKEIKTHSNIFAKGFINNNEQVLSNMWMNSNLYKDYDKSHNHPNCDISGVFYVKTPDNCGEIVFEHPAIETLSYYDSALHRLDEGRGPTEINAYNSATWRLPPIENTIYMFPSWITHSVKANENKTEERLSLSFNTKQ